MRTAHEGAEGNVVEFGFGVELFGAGEHEKEDRRRSGEWLVASGEKEQEEVASEKGVEAAVTRRSRDA
jgi:hypothetical protein